MSKKLRCEKRVETIVTYNHIEIKCFLVSPANIKTTPLSKRLSSVSQN